MATRPYTLSIAGFDPSSGAGITADVKTFEQNGVYGLGVCSAITYQNESEFEGVDWIPVEDIIRQMEILYRKYTIEYVKIGLIENLEVLDKIVLYLSEKKSRIVWDPVVKASAGFSLHTSWNSNLVQSILGNIYLLTPNIPELTFLCKLLNVKSAQELQNKTFLNALLVKDGHTAGNDCNDVLYIENKGISLNGKRIKGYTKHGTGCVLSSVIVSQLAMGVELPQACESAKRYIEKFIISNQSLLGFHA